MQKEMGSSMNKVFVYGTLKTGHYNHRVLKIGGTSKLLVDDAYITGKMFDLGPYPVVTEGDRPVKGEVWLVDDNTLERLDHLEGHPRHYERQQVPLLYSSDFLVWVYRMKPSDIPARAVPMPVANWPLKW